MEERRGDRAWRRTGIERACDGVRERCCDECDVEDDGDDRGAGPMSKRDERVTGRGELHADERSGARSCSGWHADWRSGAQTVSACRVRGRVEEGLRHAQGWHSVVERVEDVDLPPKFSFDASLQVRYCAAGVRGVDAVVGSPMLHVKKPTVTRDAEGVFGLLLEVQFVVRGRAIFGLAVVQPGSQSMGHGGGRHGRGKVVACAIPRPQFVQVDGVPKSALWILWGWGPLRRGLVAHLPAMPREAVKGVSPGLIRLFDVLGVLAAA
eukprot:6000550-Pleurochrysis_carterae.AAC.1